MQIVLIFVAMASRDLLGAVATANIAHGHGLTAGLFDAACDVCAVLSIGETALITAKSKLGRKSLAAFAALAAASMVGTFGGVWLAGVIG